MHEQLPSQSFDCINSNFSSLTVGKCIIVDGDLFSDSDTNYSNSDALISDLSNVSVKDNSEFDSDTGSSYIEDSNSDRLFSEHSDVSSENNGDSDLHDPVGTGHPNDSSSNNNFYL